MAVSKRRGQGEGSIFQRENGMWVTQVNLGRDADGKRQRRTLYGKTRKEVAAKLQAMQTELQQTGTVTQVSRSTLAEYLATWLTAAASSIRPATHASYAQYIRNHILPTLGQIEISKLQPAQLQQLYGELLTAGKSRRTVQYVHAILRRSLNQALKWGMILRSPAAAVTAPRPARRDMQVLSADQVAHFVQAIKSDPHHAFYYLALATGARRGELIALRWSDVDLTKGTVIINRTAQHVGQEIIWAEPKTARGRRLIPIPGQAVVVLRAHRVEQLAERLKVGEYFKDQGLVFCRPSGDPLPPGHLTQHFARVLKNADLPHIRLHDLRHTHATMLLGAGVHPKIVSERLGHSSITMTLDTYSHVLPSMQEEVARKLDRLLP